MRNPRTGHSLARSVRRLAVGTIRDMDARASSALVRGMAEREEQFQIGVSGAATDYPAWQTAFLPFDTVFTPATGRRESDLERPHVWIGYELTTVQRFTNNVLTDVTDGVMLTAMVRSWNFNQGAQIDGATVSIGAIAPGDQLEFSGFVHITFQGFGAPGDDTTDED